MDWHDPIRSIDAKMPARYPDFDAIVKAYRDLYGIDLSRMKMKWSKHPVYNNGKRSYELTDDETGGSWVNDGTVRINPKMGPVLKRFGIDGMTQAEFRRRIIAHELAHEVWHNQAHKKRIKKLIHDSLKQARKEKFTTPYLDTYSPDTPRKKFDSELFAEYMSKRVSDRISENRSTPRYKIHGAILGCMNGKVDYRISERLKNDPWMAVIESPGNVSMREVRKWHKLHQADPDGKRVPYYFVVDDSKTGNSYVWYTDDRKWMPINTKEEQEAAVKAGVGKGLVPEQLDFSPKTEKKAERLYTYVPRDNTVHADGILSAALTGDGYEKYRGRMKRKTKEAVLRALDAMEPGWRRSRSVSALESPIPDDAADDLREFARNSHLYSFDTKDLIKAKILEHLRETNVGRKGTHEAKSVLRHDIDWKRKPGKLLFSGIPHYMVETKDGRIPAELVRDEEKSISFPKDEIESLRGRDRIVTHRVSDEFGKHREGDVVTTPWGDRYVVSSRKEIGSPDDSPYRGHLTKGQLKQLSGNGRIAVLELKKKASARKKESYESGEGEVESYTSGKTKDHDEIVLRTKDGRRIYDTTRLKVPDRIRYLDYVSRAKKGPVLYEQGKEQRR